MLVAVRGTLGGVASATLRMAGWNVSREVAVVPADHAKVDQRFLTLWIGSRPSQRWLTRVHKGVAYTGINIEDLRKLPVSVPSAGEQAEIVRRVDQLFAFALSIERSYSVAVAKVEKLNPAILAKAFRGELVPQDPQDEPARRMLERVGRTTDMGTAKPDLRRKRATGRPSRAARA